MKKIVITKHNAYRVSKEVHKFAAKKFDFLRSVNSEFCSDCNSPIRLYIHIHRDAVNLDEPVLKALENEVIKFVKKAFDLNPEIFIINER